MENIKKSCTENPNTHFIFNNILFPENRAVYEIMWKNSVQPDRPHMTMWRMRLACWIPNATETHSECVTLIAFPLQQLLQQSTSVLRHTHVSCLVVTYFIW